MTRHSLRSITGLALVALAVTAGTAFAQDYETPLWGQVAPPAVGSTAGSSVLAAPSVLSAAPAPAPAGTAVACNRAVAGATGSAMMGNGAMHTMMARHGAFTGHAGHGSQAMGSQAMGSHAMGFQATGFHPMDSGETR